MEVADEDIGPYGEPEKYDPEFKGPIEKRSCTDILCLLLFIVFLLGWGVVAVFAIMHGDPSRLLHPTDSRGQVCGRDEMVKNKPYLYFFDLTRCATPTSVTHGCPTTQVCVEKCPSENWFFSPTDGDKNKEKMICNYDTDMTVSATTLISENKCSVYYIKSQSIVGRCIPQIISKGQILDENGNPMKIDVTSIQGNDIIKALDYLGKFYKTQEVAEGVLQDIKHVWYLILVGCFISMLVSLLWIFLLRYISGVMVWFSLIAFTALSGFIAYYTMNKYLTLRNKQEDTSTTEMSLTEQQFSSSISKYTELETTWLVMFIITVLLFVVCLIIIIFLRKRVTIAIALIGQASKAVADNMSTLFFPIFPFLLQLLFLAIFVTLTVLLTSAGSPQYRVMSPDNCTSFPDVKMNEICDPKDFQSSCPTAKCQFHTYYVKPFLPYLHIYNVFGILWLLFFISAMGEMVLAGVFSAWYWTFNKENLPSFLLCRSLRWTLVFHIGTLAFGSLIIAIVRLIRIILEYIDRKVKEKTDSQIAKAILCCCRCCLWCLEKFLKFINRNAYIYCAIYSKNFCSSARSAFNLIMRNVLRVAVLDKVTDFLLLIGKLVITGGVGVATFYIFGREVPFLSDKLPATNYYMTPVIIITIATYFISSSFFSVYEMAVDTLFLCFLEDCERNDGTSEKPYYMSKDLMKILHKENEGKKLKDE